MRSRRSEPFIHELEGDLATVITSAYGKNGQFFWCIAIMCTDKEAAAQVKTTLGDSQVWTEHTDPEKNHIVIAALSLDRIAADRLYRDATRAAKSHI